MATVVAPVELPTGRRSYYNPTPSPDIHDPNWIPVLNSALFKLPSPPVTEKQASRGRDASLSLFPSTPTLTRPPTDLSLGAPGSSVTADSIASDSSSQNTPDHGQVAVAHGSTASVQTRQNANDHASAEHTPSIAPRALGDHAARTERTSSLPTSPQDQRSDVLADAQPRCSVMSARKASIMPAVSKYSRKPVASFAGSVRPSIVPSLPQTPQESPRLSPSAGPPMHSIVVTESAPLSPKRLPTPPAERSEDAPKEQAAKSKGTERRQRALNSHPSSTSMRSRRNSNPDDGSEMAVKAPSVRHRPRKSTESRATATPRSTVYYDTPNPTPAPTTPLPQLPPEARRLPGQDDAFQQMPQPASPPVARSLDQSQLASFMVEKNTLVFRRFDEVHVQLLLCVQQEISALESELLALERAPSDNPADKILQKTRVLRELRKLVAEYDQMFTAWSTMQTTKISDATSKELRQWLQKAATSAGAHLGASAQEELRWLEKSHDLSSLVLDKHGSPDLPPQSDSLGGGSVAARGGSFLAFFTSCLGKR